VKRELATRILAKDDASASGNNSSNKSNAILRTTVSVVTEFFIKLKSDKKAFEHPSTLLLFHVESEAKRGKAMQKRGKAEARPCEETSNTLLRQVVLSLSLSPLLVYSYRFARSATYNNCALLTLTMLVMFVNISNDMTDTAIAFCSANVRIL